MKPKLMSFCLVLILLVSACSAPAETKLPPTALEPLPPTSTPQATATPEPTPTPIPTETPLPPSPTINPEPIKIGLLGPFSFSNPTFSISPQEGATLAVEEWNAKGGISGRQIELMIEDTECNLDKALDAFYRLVDGEGVRYIVGDLCSSTTAQLARLAAEKGVVLVTQGSTNPEVTVNDDGSVWPTTFRACVVDPFQGTMMAKYAYDQGYKTGFLLYEAGNDYSLGVASAFEEKFTSMGGKIAGSELYQARSTDFSATLDKIKQSQTEVVFIPGYAADVSEFGRQAQAAGVHGVFLGSDYWDSSELDLQAVEGGLFINHHHPNNPSTSVQKWNSQYSKRFSDDQGQPKVPDMLATLTYDATNMLLEAIEQVGVDDPAMISEILASGTWKMITGVTRFDKFHNPIKPVVIMGIKNGEIVFVDIAEP